MMNDLRRLIFLAIVVWGGTFVMAWEVSELRSDIKRYNTQLGTLENKLDKLDRLIERLDKLITRIKEER